MFVGGITLSTGRRGGEEGGERGEESKFPVKPNCLALAIPF